MGTERRCVPWVTMAHGTQCLRYRESQFSHQEVNNMQLQLTNDLGMILLGIWLIVTGLLQVVKIPIPAIGTVLAVLAIAAGVVILLVR